MKHVSWNIRRRKDGSYNDEWSCTIITKFNELSEGLTGTVNIKIPNKYKELIEGIILYDDDNGFFGTQYKIDFIKSESDFMMIGNKKLNIIEKQNE